jgi:sugar/nucleoside kinase (ribokinase family)
MNFDEVGMTIKYGVIGAFTIDNVINNRGELGVYQCGGNAFYSAVGARLWSDSIGVVARIGDDYPREWVRQLESHGVDITGVREVNGAHMMQGGMLYDETGERSGFVPQEYFASQGLPLPEGLVPKFPGQDIEVYNKAQWDFAPDPEDVPERFLKAESFHLAPRFYTKHQRSVSFLKANGIQVFMDPGIWYMRERDEQKIVELFKDVDVLMPSQAEVKAFFGERGIPEAARRLADYGPRVVAVKMGRDGSLIYDKGSDLVFSVPCYPASVKDPTGAGDSYCGGFMVGYSKSGDPLQAAMCGTVSASFVVEGFGAAYALQVTNEQAEERLHKVTEIFYDQPLANRM